MQPFAKPTQKQTLMTRATPLLLLTLAGLTLFTRRRKSHRNSLAPIAITLLCLTTFPISDARCPSHRRRFAGCRTLEDGTHDGVILQVNPNRARKPFGLLADFSTIPAAWLSMDSGISSPMRSTPAAGPSSALISATGQ